MNFDEIIQNTAKVIKRFDELGKVVDFVNEELIPEIFKDKTEEVYELNWTLVKNIVKHL
ncbi:MAG: hypothetical protein ACTSU2_04495 [Promethearchaeota archaeon]